MRFWLQQVDVWVATIKDEIVGLADVLSALRDEGAKLQSVIARRAPDKPGTAVVFVTPLQGDKEIAAAAQGVSMSRRRFIRCG